MTIVVKMDGDLIKRQVGNKGKRRKRDGFSTITPSRLSIQGVFLELCRMGPVHDLHQHPQLEAKGRRVSTKRSRKILKALACQYSAVSLVQPNTERLISQLLFGLEFWRSLEGDLKSPMHCTIHLKFT